jgi:hypothetical protein
VLYVALELSHTTWKLAFNVGPGRPPRIRSIPARCATLMMSEIKKAKSHLGLPENAKVVSCYEAGRDGFWIHRLLVHEGVENIVVDSASIEVNRRKRRAKSDRLDVTKLVSMLIRWHNGERNVWSVGRVPGVTDEDRRQLHRGRQLVSVHFHWKNELTPIPLGWLEARRHPLQCLRNRCHPSHPHPSRHSHNRFNHKPTTSVKRVGNGQTHIFFEEFSPFPTYTSANRL